MMKTIISITMVAIRVTSLWFRVKPTMYARLPSPPAPMTPAMAVEPTSMMAVTVMPEMRAGMDSGMSTFRMMVHVSAPMDSAASMTPLSISLSPLSTSLAYNGPEPMISAGIAPFGPMMVPIITFVNGIRRMISMMNGIALNRFTRNAVIPYIGLLALTSLFEARNRMMPSTMPNMNVNAV